MEKQNPKTAESWEQRCWEDLAIAIILQALDDYTAPGGDSYGAKRRREDAYRFLNSWWFDALNPTGYTGNELIRFAERHETPRRRQGCLEDFQRDNWRNEQ